MDRFVANYTNKLDAKGRVSIPAPFRAVLARDGHEGLFVTPSLDHPALDCGGNAMLAEIDALMAPLGPYSAERESIAMTLLGESEVLKMDGEGRLIIPDRLKEHVGITSDVTFVGTGRKFQIWEPGRFEARRLEAKQQTRAMRQRLGSQSAADDPVRPHSPGARE